MVLRFEFITTKNKSLPVVELIGYPVFIYGPTPWKKKKSEKKANDQDSGVSW